MRVVGLLPVGNIEMPSASLVLPDLSQVGLHRVRASWMQVAQQYSPDSHRINPQERSL
jgi:hypothetical protein